MPIQLLMNAVLAGSIYSLVAIAFFVVLQTARFIPFSHGAVYAFGAYFAYLFSIQIGVDRVAAFPLACFVTILVGIGCEVAVYTPMSKKRATELTLLISSLGLYIVLQNIISMIWGDDIKGEYTDFTDGPGIVARGV